MGFFLQGNNFFLPLSVSMTNSFSTLLMEQDLQKKITLVLGPDFKLVTLGRLGLLHGYWVCLRNTCVRTDLVSYS